MTQREIEEFLKKQVYRKVEDEQQLSGYNDRLMTQQQKIRDVQITELLKEYVNFYQAKVKHGKICRYIILIPCILIIGVFAGMLCIFVIKAMRANWQFEVEGVVAFVTACVSFISLIIGLLTIITKYFFPENDEQYIATIVETIQRNDLENKRENARYEHPAEDGETLKRE